MNTQKVDAGSNFSVEKPAGQIVLDPAGNFRVGNPASQRVDPAGNFRAGNTASQIVDPAGNFRVGNPAGKIVYCPFDGQDCLF